MKDLREQFESILHRAKIIQEGKDGTLHIGIFGGDRVDERVLTSLDFFQEKYPKIELSLLRGTNNDLIRGLFNSTIDVAFALKIDVEEKKWLVYKQLFSLNTILLVNVKHPLARKENLSLSDFRDDTFISISSDQSPAINSLLKQECEKAGFAPKIIDAPDTNSQILYLQAGKGVAICSLNNIAVYKSRIMPLPLRELKSLDFGIVWNSTNDNPCIELFVSAYELIE